MFYFPFTLRGGCWKPVIRRPDPSSTCVDLIVFYIPPSSNRFRNFLVCDGARKGSDPYHIRGTVKGQRTRGRITEWRPGLWLGLPPPHSVVDSSLAGLSSKAVDWNRLGYNLVRTIVPTGSDP